MHSSIPLLAAAFLATGANAMLPFSLLAIDSGTDLQYAPIHANNLSLTIGLPTTTAPPPPNIPGIDPRLYLNDTSFTLPSPGPVGGGGGSSPLFMNIQTTGVQYLYVSSLTGQARITPAHTDFIPDGGVSDFSLVGDGVVNLQFADGSVAPWACGPVGGPYQVFYNVPALDTVGCREIALFVVGHATAAYGGWAYS